MSASNSPTETGPTASCEACLRPVREGLRYCPGLSVCWKWGEAGGYLWHRLAMAPSGDTPRGDRMSDCGRAVSNGRDREWWIDRGNFGGRVGECPACACSYAIPNIKAITWGEARDTRGDKRELKGYDTTYLDPWPTGVPQTITGAVRFAKDLGADFVVFEANVYDTLVGALMWKVTHHR